MSNVDTLFRITLLQFVSLHGHCRVPHGYPPNPKLSWWVMNQRAQFAHQAQGKKTWLTEDRVELLDNLGFTWSPHYNTRKKRDAQVVSSSNDDEAAATSIHHTTRKRKRAKGNEDTPLDETLLETLSK